MTRRAAAVSRRTPGAWGTVEQLPSGRWRAFYRRDGRKFSAPTTFAARAEGDAWLAAEFADRARGVWRDPSAGRVDLGTFARDWLATRADLSPVTLSHYEHALSRWVLPRIGAGDTSRGVELGTMDVADITPATVRTWYAAALTSARARLAERHAADASRRRDPVRAWARSQGLAVADTGRLSPRIVAEWERAGSPMLPTPATPLPENAGRAAVTSAYRLLRTLLNVAVTDGMLERNPCQIKGAGESKGAERNTATPAEVATIAAHMPRRLRVAVLLAAWSGLRAGELFALARRHIDFTAETVTVERALVDLPGQPITFGTPKTAKSRRKVSLPAFVMAELRTHLDEFVPDELDALVFTASTGRPLSASRRTAIFGKARAAAGREDLTWHDLRHTGATLAYRAGASVPEVQRRLGHTTMRAAQTYAHAADDSDQIIAARLDALYAGESTAPRLRAI
ncbi:tyrosine-type recombinase/integrase [Microbacterium sp. GXF6406]